MIADAPALIGAILTLYGLVAAAAVTADWITVLQWVPRRGVMVPTTAACVLLSGVMFSFCRQGLRHERRIPGLIVTTCALWILLTETMVALCAVSNWTIAGFSMPFNREATFQTTAPGAQSIGTITAFTFVGLMGLAVTFNTANFRKRALVCGTAVGAIALCALIGHAFDVPSLYYHYPHASIGAAMALPTAICLALASTACFLLSRAPHD